MPEVEQRNKQPPSSAKYTAMEAAVLLLLLGEEAASEIIKYLSPREIRIISDQTENLALKSSDELHDLLRQFEHEFINSSIMQGNHQEQMRHTLQKALGREQARCLLTPPGQEQEQLTGLQLMKPELLVSMIREEPLQFQAAILACLQNDQASDALALLPAKQSEDILERMARLESLPRSSMKAIIDFMDSFLNEQAIDEFLPVAGEQQVANILNLSDNRARDRFLGKLKESDRKLAGRIEEQMLVFEHIVYLNDDDTRTLLNTVEQEQLALALKGESKGVKQKVFNSMGKRASNYLKDEISILGAVPASKVKAARQRIVTQMDTLLRSKEIKMSRSREQMLE